MTAYKFLLTASLAASVLAAPAIVEERQNCASVWGQCGGNGWTGPTCCASGSTCVGMCLVVGPLARYLYNT